MAFTTLWNRFANIGCIAFHDVNAATNLSFHFDVITSSVHRVEKSRARSTYNIIRTPSASTNFRNLCQRKTQQVFPETFSDYMPSDITTHASLSRSARVIWVPTLTPSRGRADRSYFSSMWHRFNQQIDTFTLISGTSTCRWQRDTILIKVNYVWENQTNSMTSTACQIDSEQIEILFSDLFSSWKNRIQVFSSMTFVRSDYAIRGHSSLCRFDETQSHSIFSIIIHAWNWDISGCACEFSRYGATDYSFIFMFHVPCAASPYVTCNIIIY